MVSKPVDLFEFAQGRLVETRANHHVRVAGAQRLNHLMHGVCRIGAIAIHHDINIGIDVPKHGLNHIALALPALPKDMRTSRAGNAAVPSVELLS